MRRKVREVSFVLLGLLPVTAAVTQEPGEVEARARDDERSAVLLVRECASELGRQELTLFANGTVRLREGPRGEERMMLGEMPPDVLQGWVDNLRREDLSEADVGSRGPTGDWVESCEVTLSFGTMERWLGPPPVRGRNDADWRPMGDETFIYGRFDSLPLSLSRVIGLLDGLLERVDRAAGRQSLPPRYVPRRGDVLRRVDGVLFRVVARTADENGWELQGVEQPLVLYVVGSDVPRLFVELVERR
jgi:hypothetical protein